MNIRFGNVSESGTTTVDPIDPSAAGPALAGYSLVGPAFNITTTATSSGPYNICISVPYITDAAAFQKLKLLHNEGGVLVDRTTGQDPVNKMVCGNAPTLSPFVVALGSTPTAEIVSVSGHITDADGNPIEGAAIRMTLGSYWKTPSRANFSFSPAQRSFSAMGQHTDAAFMASSTGGGSNPLDRTEYFVRQQYVDFLGREPDETGFNFWVNNIESCGANANCRGQTDRHVRGILPLDRVQRNGLSRRPHLQGGVRQPAGRARATHAR